MDVSDNSPGHALKLRLEKATRMQWRPQENELFSEPLPFNTDNIRQLAVLAVSLNSILKSMGSNAKKGEGYPARTHHVYPVSIKSDPEKTKGRQTRLVIHHDDIERFCDDLGVSVHAAAMLSRLRDFIAEPKAKGYLRSV